MAMQLLVLRQGENYSTLIISKLAPIANFFSKR